MYKIIGADQKEYGPITLDQMQQWIAEGRVNAQTLVWSETSNNWKPIGAYAEFAAAVPPLPPGATPPPMTGMPQGSRPSNYLVPAILSTICCCLPFGIVAIVYAAQVNGKWDAGDSQGAQDAAKKAKMWIWVSVIATVVATAAYFALAALGVGAGLLNQ